MATVDLKQHESKSKSGEVPPYFRDRVTLRIKEAQYKIGKTAPNNPRLDLVCEIINPLSVKVGDVEYGDLNKQDISFMLMLNDANLKYAYEFHTKLGLPTEIDPENPDKSIYQGVCFDVILSSQEDFAEKVVDGKRERIKDGAGKDISLGNRFVSGMLNSYSLKNVLGRNTEDWSHLAF